jgi:hypothetical protein
MNDTGALMTFCCFQLPIVCPATSQDLGSTASDASWGPKGFTLSSDSNAKWWAFCLRVRIDSWRNRKE